MEFSKKNLHTSAFQWKQKLLFIRDDIQGLKKRVSGTHYKSEIPNLFERLALFTETIAKLESTLDEVEKGISLFENRLGEMVTYDTSSFDDSFIEKYWILNSKVEDVEKNHKSMKASIIEYTSELD